MKHFAKLIENLLCLQTTLWTPITIIHTSLQNVLNWRVIRPIFSWPTNVSTPFSWYFLILPLSKAGFMFFFRFIVKIIAIYGLNHLIFELDSPVGSVVGTFEASDSLFEGCLTLWCILFTFLKILV